MRQLRIHQLVLGEFNEAVAWYAARSSLAARHFELGFIQALDAVRRNPLAQSPWLTMFRRRRLTRFPYLLIFHVDRRFTSVLALVHDRREPSAVLSKLGSRLSGFER